MNHPETQLQIAVADYLDIVCPYPWSAIGHGVNIGYQRGRRLKNAGVRRGLPDILIFTPTGTISIELKSPKGRQTPDQKSLGEWLNEQPAHSYYVCRSVDDVQAVLVGLCVVRAA